MSETAQTEEENADAANEQMVCVQTLLDLVDAANEQTSGGASCFGFGNLLVAPLF